jgi:hypothetical protein
MATSTPPNGNGGVVYKIFSARLNIQPTNNRLNLTWSVPGAQLQVQANGPGGGLKNSNWFNVGGTTATNQVSVPIDPTQGSVFYRLLFPSLP